MERVLNPRYDATDRVVFVSDVHLYYEGDAYLEQFLVFLDGVRERGTAALYVHGDLFDFYVGPRQGKRPFYAPLFERLRALVTAGVPVGILHGNRDFLMGKRFTEAGCTVLPDEITLQLGDRTVHLSHGDQFCIHDTSYQFWARGVLRAGPFRFLVRNLPVPIATWLARRYRKVSARKFKKHATGRTSRLPTVLDGVKRLVEAGAHDDVICGHIHHLATTPIVTGERSATLWTTGAWEEGPNFVLWEEGVLALRRFDPATRAAAAPAS